MKINSSGTFADIHNTLHIDGQALLIKLKHPPRTWQAPIAIFLSGRILFSLWGVLIWAMRLMPSQKGYFYFNIEPVLEGPQGALLGMWQRWDSIHYQQIAMSGYVNDALTAFFPLFPFLGRWASFLIGNHTLLGLIIVSNFSFLIALWLLYQIVCEEFTPELAFETLFNLIIFPSGFFFYSIYPQSLLLMLALLAYWLAHRGQWTWAGIVGFFAGLTHSTAAAITPLLAWEAWRCYREGKVKNRIAMAIAPLTNLLGIGAFLTWRQLAGLPPYREMLMGSWGRNSNMPWDGLMDIGKVIINLSPDPLQFMSWISVFIFLIIILCTAWSVRKIPIAMWLYQAALLVIILSTTAENSPLLGILRYPLVMFPLFIELAIVTRTRGQRLLKFSIFLLLSLVCSAWFFMWKFVG